MRPGDAHAAPVAHGRKIIAGRPILGAGLDMPVNLIRGEALQRHGAVTEIFVTDLLKIIAARVHVEVLAPVGFDPFIGDRVSGRELLEPVGATTERLLKRGLGYVSLLARGVGTFPPMLW